jgi:Flp pilus assembly protein TadD
MTPRLAAAPKPGQHEIEALVALFGQRRYAEAEQLARALTARFPHDGFGWKALGAVLKRLRRLGATILPLGRAAEPAQREGKIREQLEALFATEADRQRARDLGS